MLYSTDIYIPKGNWYEFFTSKFIEVKDPEPKTIEIKNNILIYIKAGSIIPRK
jgi:alpha-glucosidase (family GH31 glycosyl hydrolase)